MKNIKYLVMDVDGSLTDGKLYIGDSGEAFKAFDVRDGYGIHELLPEYGITPVLLTGRKSKIVKRRCDELEINKIYQGVSDKLAELSKITSDFFKVAYIGDDLPDIICMQTIKDVGGVLGYSCDAVDQIKEISDFICDKKGGNGAVREFIEWLL